MEAQGFRGKMCQMLSLFVGQVCLQIVKSEDVLEIVEIEVCNLVEGKVENGWLAAGHVVVRVAMFAVEAGNMVPEEEVADIVVE